jgi:hypothetical protein
MLRRLAAVFEPPDRRPGQTGAFTDSREAKQLQRRHARQFVPERGRLCSIEMGVAIDRLVMLIKCHSLGSHR